MDGNQKIRITVSLFGAFRKYTNGKTLSIAAAQGSTVGDLRPIIEAELRSLCPGFHDAGLVQDSAFASGTELINEETILANGDSVYVLPPVCGG